MDLDPSRPDIIRHGRIRRRPRAIAAVVAISFVCGLGLAMWLRFGRPMYPEYWDPEVADLVNAVEEISDGSFATPIHVNFVSPDEYDDRASKAWRVERYVRATGWIGSAGREADADLVDQALLRAVGVLNGVASQSRLNEDELRGGPAAFYDMRAKQIYVRGITLSAANMPVVVHELAHAFHDQRYSLTATFAKARSPLARQTLAYLVEGAAFHVESEWFEALSESQRKAISAAHAGPADRYLGARGLPDVYRALQSARSIVAQNFFAVLFAHGGAAAIDTAFANPPNSPEYLLDPVRFINEAAGVTGVGGGGSGDVPKPQVPSGVEVLREGSAGPIFWYLAFADSSQPETALDAVRHWNSDKVVVYRTSNQEREGICFSSTIEMDSLEAAHNMREELELWTYSVVLSDAFPPEQRSFYADGTQLRVHACDPGSESEVRVYGDLDSELRYLNVRNALLADLLTTGVTANTADCYANELIFYVSVNQNEFDIEAVRDTPEFQAGMADARLKCPA